MLSATSFARLFHGSLGVLVIRQSLFVPEGLTNFSYRSLISSCFCFRRTVGFILSFYADVVWGSALAPPSPELSCPVGFITELRAAAVGSAWRNERVTEARNERL